MKSFLQFLLELYHRPRIIRNPTKDAVAYHLNKSDGKNLRYLHKDKHAWITDGYHATHEDLYDHAGVEWTDKHANAGYILNSHIDRIRDHPKGLHGWIKDRHAKHNTNYIDDVTDR
jgi:hypothetical protein